MQVLLTNKVPISTPILIEISGLPKSGKALISTMLSARFNAENLIFPNLNPASITGKGLNSAIRNVEALSKTPALMSWWEHLSFANYLEQAPKFNQPLVFTVNYYYGHKALFNTTEFKHIPIPNKAYQLTDTLRREYSTPCYFTPEIEKLYSNRLKKNNDKKITRVKLVKAKEKSLDHIRLNDYLDFISEDIKKIYGFEYNGTISFSNTTSTLQ